MDQSDIIYTRVSSGIEMRQILDLQQKNLPENLRDAEIASEGFLTVSHSLDLLSRMNEVCPHMIAKAGGQVIGYALCMHPSFRDRIEVLKSMFDKIDSLASPDLRYIVMGQICIDKKFRKRGIFRGLYRFMGSELRLDYQMIITEVDDKNRRSLNAHYAVGFREMNLYPAGGRKWHLISWDLR